MKHLLRWAPVLLVIACFGIYAGIFVFKSSFVIDGDRYFSLFDDPMISMRYAKNLAEGFGPVWNPGEDPVEGFSNPLWVGVMALVHLLPLPLSQTSLAVQVLSGLLLVANLMLVACLARELSGGNGLVACLAVVFTAFYYPLNNWALLGNDVAPAALLSTLVAWLVIAPTRRGRAAAWIYSLLGVGTLLRLDLAVLYVVVWAYLLWVERERRRFHLLWGGGILLAFVLGQTAARYAYYGDLWPNPYYLKMTGGATWLRLVRGLFVLVKVIWNFNPVIFVLPFIVLPAARDRRMVLLMAVVLAFAAYSVYVGGDAWEHRGGANRFLATGISLYFVLLACALEVLRRAVMQGLPSADRRSELLSQGALLLVSAVALLNANALLDTSSLRAAFLFERPVYSVGNERNTTIGLFLRRTTDEQARIAYVAAGAAPYFADREAIDLMGKSDRRVARGPMRIPEDMALIDYRPGHMKRDYAYSIGELKPDVVVEVWPGTNAEAAPFLKDYVEIRVPELERWLPDGRMYLRQDSPHVRWEEIDVYLYQPESAP